MTAKNLLLLSCGVFVWIATLVETGVPNYCLSYNMVKIMTGKNKNKENVYFNRA